MLLWHFTMVACDMLLWYFPKVACDRLWWHFPMMACDMLCGISLWWLVVCYCDISI